MGPENNRTHASFPCSTHKPALSLRFSSTDSGSLVSFNPHVHVHGLRESLNASEIMSETKHKISDDGNRFERSSLACNSSLNWGLTHSSSAVDRSLEIQRTFTEQPPTPPSIRENLDERQLRDATPMYAGDALNTALSRRNDPGLRLPSFKVLGIAASKYISDGPMQDSENITVEIHRQVTSALSIVNPSTAKHDFCFPKPYPHPISQYVATLTPPAEQSEGRYYASQPSIISALSAGETNSSRLADLPSHGLQDQDVQDASCSTRTNNFTEPDYSDKNVHWIQEATQILSHALLSAITPGQPAKVLSHALPCTSSEGHIYNSVVNALKVILPGNVELCHAIPGKFNLADLPKSPPATPTSHTEEGDYFNQIFSTGVNVIDYQEKNTTTTTTPRSPHPIVSPASIHLSIVERYIPPTSAREFSHMFDLRGPSILIDRLVELNARNGHLMLIYPTLKGATTFVNEHLSPIIDPLLRTMTVVHDLSSSLGMAISQMAAIQKMLEYEDIRDRIDRLCTDINQLSPSMKRAYGGRARFEVVYASRQHVELNKDVWAKEWWAKQEKARVRELMKQYTKHAEKRHSYHLADRAATSTELTQKLFDALSKESSGENSRRSDPIEVGVFLIRRTE